MRPKIIYPGLFFCLYMSSLLGQTFELPNNFLAVANKYNLEVSTPTENRFKPIYQFSNEYVPFIFGMQSNKADLEMYVAFQPFDSLSPATFNPQIETTRLMTNAATNKEDAVITVLDLGKNYVLETFGADWGKEIYFQPKGSLSEKEHCRMVSVYQEGTGLLSLFFFFNEKDNYLDDFYNWIRFSSKKQLPQDE